MSNGKATSDKQSKADDDWRLDSSNQPLVTLLIVVTCYGMPPPPSAEKQHYNIELYQSIQA